MSYLSIPDNVKVHFVGCTHFYHENIIKFCNRPFDNAIHMNNVLVDNINARVAPDDVLVSLGDFAFGRDKIGNVRAILDRLTCKNIYLVLGNHDAHHKIPEMKRMFLDVFDYLEIWHKNNLMVCSHYPHEAWNESHRGSYHVHSHVHFSLGDAKTRRHDCGVDNPWMNYGSREWNEIVEHLMDREIRTFDKGRPDAAN